METNSTFKWQVNIFYLNGGDSGYSGLFGSTTGTEFTDYSDSLQTIEDHNRELDVEEERVAGRNGGGGFSGNLRSFLEFFGF
jgi:hypothetical protein